MQVGAGVRLAAGCPNGETAFAWTETRTATECGCGFFCLRLQSSAAAVMTMAPPPHSVLRETVAASSGD